MKSPFFFSIRWMVILAVALLVGFSQMSCKKDDDKDENPQPNPQPAVEAPVNFMVHPMRGNQPMVYGIDHPVTLPWEDRKVSFEIAQLYLSGFELLKADGSTVKFKDTYVLVTKDAQTFNLGQAPSGDYTGIRFQIGVDSAANHSDPSLRAPNHPLALRDPSMHWTWNSGYIFIKAEGDFDCEVGLGPDHQQCESFKYHVGTLPLLRTVELNHSIKVQPGAGGTFHVNIDWLKIFEGLNLPDDKLTHTMNNRPLAEKIANNGPKMFKIAHH